MLTKGHPTANDTAGNIIRPPHLPVRAPTGIRPIAPTPPAAAIAIDGADWDPEQELLTALATPRVSERVISLPDAPLEALRRWEDSAAVWRVLSRSGAGVEIALLACSADEEVSRIRTDHPDVVAYIGDREGNN